MGDLPPLAWHLYQPATQIHSTIEDVKVIEIFSLSEIDTDASTSGKEIRLILDIDDTLYVHGKDGQFFSLGSRAWRADIKAQISEKLELWLQENPEIQKQIPSDHSPDKITQNLHDYLTWFLAHQLPVETVEPNTAAWIQQQQNDGIDTSLLTARETQIWYWLKGLHVSQTDGLPVADLTAKQLQSLGIDMDSCISFSLESFDRGVHFSPHNEKGEYFTELMLPSLQIQGLDLTQIEFIFIDDKKAQCRSMAEAFSKARIPYRSYYYRAAETLNEQYDPSIASFQLYTLWQSKESETPLILSDKQAKNLIDSEQEADWYLKQVVLDALKAYYGSLQADN